MFNLSIRARALAALSALALGVSITTGFTQNYKLDTAHSYVNFRIKHLNVGWSYGRFNKFEGTIVVDEKNPSRSSVNFTIDANSVDTNNTRRDDHLRGPDFFNARQFPTMTFKSRSSKKINATTAEITGDLTIKGITKPLTVRVVRTGMGEMRGQQLIGMETTFKIKRSDFGITYGLPGLADEVALTISIEAIKQ